MSGWTLLPEQAGASATHELVARRERAAGTMPADAPAECVIGGVRCLTVGEGVGATVLWLHGGGYRMGSPVAYIMLARRVAQAIDGRVILPFYRLAPEHPFPAALNDAAAVYRALDGPVILAGDSAGGGLACALAMVAQEAGRPAAGAILLSPMLDLTAANATYDSHAERDPFISRASVLECAGLYLAGQPSDDPRVSPLNADPAMLPPVLLLIGGGEVLLGESLAFARSLALADRAVTLHAAAGMGHVWPLLAPDSAATEAALEAMAGFVRAQAVR